MACLQLQGVSHLHQYVRFSRCTNHTAAFSVRTYFRGNMWRKFSNDMSRNTLGRAGMNLKTTSGDKWHLNCCCVGLAPRCRSVPGQVMNVFSFDLLMHDSNGQRMRQLSWDVKLHWLTAEYDAFVMLAEWCSVLFKWRSIWWSSRGPGILALEYLIYHFNDWRIIAVITFHIFVMHYGSRFHRLL